ncbi:MAG: methyl-accepting chemotaxis protein [Sulfuricella sp.]|nr:methyl-accepting chemotaxis protein [Sulfuricella sp.]
MNWIKHSIRNKLFLISGTGTTLLLASSLLGLWLAWGQIQTLEQEVAAYQNAGQQVQAASQPPKTQIKARAGAQNGIMISLGLMAAAIVIAFFAFLWLVQKNILNPANQLVQDLDRLARGDFSSAISCTTDDELGKIAASAEQIRIDLGGVIAKVNNITAKVCSTASRLSDTASMVTSGSNQQSEAAEATAAAVEEMAVSISSVAENADNVNRISRSGMEHTVKGNESLSELIGEITTVESSVEEIAAAVSEFIRSTEAITNMTRQVKDIAEQTNLLALTAAIEAARAGEQGRGFAVVADEVRKLAEKSAQSASQIDQVTMTLGSQSAAVAHAIQHSQKSLQTSQDYLENVAMVLGEANQSVVQSTEGVENIARSVNEQKTASHEIAQNVERIAQMTEANRSAIQENAAATRHMEQLADDLRGMVSHFKV